MYSEIDRQVLIPGSTDSKLHIITMCYINGTGSALHADVTHPANLQEVAAMDLNKCPVAGRVYWRLSA